MVKCESLRINMFRITHTGNSMNFPVTTVNLRSFFFFFCISRTYRVLTAFSVLCLTKDKFVRSLGLKNIYEETVG